MSSPATTAPPAPGTEAPEAAPKARKERKERKPRANVQVWKLYKISAESGTAQRLKKECPRCGKGYFMAEHRDRLSCGNCGYTTFKSKT